MWHGGILAKQEAFITPIIDLRFRKKLLQTLIYKDFFFHDFIHVPRVGTDNPRPRPLFCILTIAIDLSGLILTLILVMGFDNKTSQTRMWMSWTSWGVYKNLSIAF